MPPNRGKSVVCLVVVKKKLIKKPPEVFEEALDPKQLLLEVSLQLIRRSQDLSAIAIL